VKRTRIEKRPIDPQRIRRIPQQGFSWIDRRFVRQGFLAELPREAIPLYFFLLAVSDANGMSFYADPTVCRLLKLTAEELEHARYWLSKAELVLYRSPLYQVLALPAERVALHSSPSASSATSRRPRGGEPISLQEFLASLAPRSGS
jgi:hypothetical protein